MTAIGPGMRVVCVRHEGDIEPGLSPDTPRVGSKWTVNWAAAWWDGLPYVGLIEWPEPDVCFLASCFRPLDGDEELARLREIVKEPKRQMETV